MDDHLYVRAGATANGPWALDVTPERAGWDFSGLRVLHLSPGQAQRVRTGGDEMIVLPLHGSCAITCEGQKIELAGREDVFSGPTDFAYLPIGVEATLTAQDGGSFALPSARATRAFPVRHVAADQVPVELRGSGSCSREVHNFAAADVFEADRLIAVEVLTPGGNWSSYPPHKHDEASADETVLEEIYYFQVARSGPAYQRVYGTSRRPLDLLAEVRSGDVVLIPYGWHGPSMAAPGYDLYYLNVMAGPGERAWRVRHDPAHDWVRDTWPDDIIDPRLPLNGHPR
ncbi:MAG TPA: 5-deoxy-glucuronate isomerase [Streptosporangiaceae bacterium]|jgi:5-deoxy-glucuronate isomerase